MGRMLHIFTLFFFIFSMYNISSAQEQEQIEYSMGVVVNVSYGKIVVKEFNYNTGQEVDVIYTIDSQTELRNVESIADIATDDRAGIEYALIDSSKVARIITVEKSKGKEFASEEAETVPQPLSSSEASSQTSISSEMDVQLETTTPRE